MNNDLHQIPETENPDENKELTENKTEISDQLQTPETSETPELIVPQETPETTKVPEAIIDPEESVVDTPSEDTEVKSKPKRTTAKKSIKKDLSKPVEEIPASDTVEEAEPLDDLDCSDMDREQLLEILKETVKDDNISRIKARVGQLRVAFYQKTNTEKQIQLDQFIEGGGQKDDFVFSDQLEDDFKIAFDVYRKKKILFNEEKDREKLRNLEIKKQILEELRTLVGSEEALKKTYDDFKVLQDRWKLVGQVPSAEVNNLWQNYHFLVEKFFDKVKINKELKDLDLKKNMELKIQLCEKAEELLLSKSMVKSFKQLQKYHDEWKDIGPVPSDKKDELWERFKTVSDNINLYRKDYYLNLSAEQENNLIAKTALCEKMEQIVSEEISSASEWKLKSEDTIEIQKLWETIGRVSPEKNDEIYARFRTAINSFFDYKKEFFGELKDQQTHNYNLKLELCVQAESLVNNTNWKQATAELLHLQDEWKKIGSIPKKHSDKIWKRFRFACDEYFKRKSEYFVNIKVHEQENLKKKEELIKTVSEYIVVDNKAQNLEALKNFQREFTETGHVPMEQKDTLQTKFRNAINGMMEKMKISVVEMQTIAYKSKLDNLKNSPDSNKALFKERSFIEDKIRKIRSDIMLWENNIGFFAQSKKADILRDEFELKILKAKEEALLLEAKLKLLAKQN